MRSVFVDEGWDLNICHPQLVPAAEPAFHLYNHSDGVIALLEGRMMQWWSGQHENIRSDQIRGLATGCPTIVLTASEGVELDGGVGNLAFEELQSAVRAVWHDGGVCVGRGAGSAELGEPAGVLRVDEICELFDV